MERINYMELPKEEPNHQHKRKATLRQQKVIEPEEMNKLYD